jgi:hypothetical protein
MRDQSPARVRHEVRAQNFFAFDARRVLVTLPAPLACIAFDGTARDETTPRTRTIRYTGPLDPLRFDPVLRHADKRRDLI